MRAHTVPAEGDDRGVPPQVADACRDTGRVVWAEIVEQALDQQ